MKSPSLFPTILFLLGIGISTASAACNEGSCYGISNSNQAFNPFNNYIVCEGNNYRGYRCQCCNSSDCKNCTCLDCKTHIVPTAQAVSVPTVKPALVTTLTDAIKMALSSKKSCSEQAKVLSSYEG